jgi:hypothetical protein
MWAIKVKILFMKTYLTFLALFVSSFVIGQDASCPTKIRIKNSSKYQIEKLVIFEKQFERIPAESASNFLCIEKFYSNGKFDITFSEKGKWSHVIEQPVDVVGEKLKYNGAFQLSFFIKKMKGKYKIYYKISQIKN